MGGYAPRPASPEPISVLAMEGHRGPIVLAMFSLLLCGNDALMVASAPAAKLRADLRMVVKGREWETANVPRGKVTMNPFQNLKQMQVRSDRRPAEASN